MASKYNKKIPHHGHADFVFVVDGVHAGCEEDGKHVLGVFTDYQMAMDKMELWSVCNFVDLDCIAHDLRYPLAK